MILVLLILSLRTVEKAIRAKSPNVIAGFSHSTAAGAPCLFRSIVEILEDSVSDELMKMLGDGTTGELGGPAP